MRRSALRPSVQSLLVPVLAGALAVCLPLFPPAAAAPNDDDDVRVIIDKVRAVTVDGPWLGVALGSRETNGRKVEGDGAQIISVFEGSPAEAAGLEAGDLIIRFDGTAIVDLDGLLESMNATRAGDRVVITVLRDGAEQTFDVTLGRKGDSPGSTWTGTFEGLRGLEGFEGLEGLEKLEKLDRMPLIASLIHGEAPDVYVGIVMQDLTGELRDYFGAPQGSGLLVSSVRADSPAGRAGLKAGDVVVSVDGETVTSPGDFSSRLAGREAGEILDLGVIRDRREISVQVTLEKRPDGFGGQFTFDLGNRIRDNIRMVAPHAFGEREAELAERIRELERQIEMLNEKIRTLGERVSQD